MIEPCHQPDELIKIDVSVSILVNDAHHVLIVLTSKVLMINPSHFPRGLNHCKKFPHRGVIYFWKAERAHKKT